MRNKLFFLLTSCLCTGLATPSQAQVQGKDGIQLPAPPQVATHPVTDTYQGAAPGQPASFVDPYQWLEDAKSPETRAFIEAQNAYTAEYFRQVKILPQAARQIGQLLRVDSYGIPVERNGRFFFSRRKPEENQASIYMRVGIHGEDHKLIDANTLSADQNTSVNIEDLTTDGSLLAYGLRIGGADEQEVHFLNTTTGKEADDKLPTARYYTVQIAPDAKGVYYSRFYPHDGTRVYYHPFGGDAAQDELIIGKQFNGEPLTEIDNMSVRTTDNGHFLVITIGRGVPAKRVDVVTKDLTRAGSPLVPLIYGIEARFDDLTIGDTFYFRTDWKAPRGRVIRAVAGQSPDTWPTLIPEGHDVIEQVSAVGGKLYVNRLKDVHSETTAYTAEGKLSGEIKYPGLGAGTVLYGRDSDSHGFYSFQSIISPPAIYYYDTATGNSSVFATTNVPFDSAQYELRQVFYTSKDGTRVPMFIAGKKGLHRDGSERLLMTGYGGFALSEMPTWSGEYAWWLSQGGWFALPNLRGGNEYGEDWHKAAMFANKQNVFDDWYAAAEYLIREKYTIANRFAIRGRSNGGLLMGASMTQRPDLFGAIWCGYPLLDMLRYQKFLMGRTWTTEYGNAENVTDYSYIRKYSPYQNVKPGTHYPAILFFTGDGDTRVDPMNARKMTPMMQQATSSGRPVLLHYSIKGGHSAGVSLSQLIEDYADEMSFLWTETGK